MTVIERPLARPITETDSLLMGERSAPRPASWLPQGDGLRIGAAIAIVLLHVANVNDLEFSKTAALDWWVCNFADALCRWAMPAFIMLSGALLLHPAKEESLEVFFRKRVTRIGIPFVFWTIFYLLLRVYKEHGSFGLRQAVASTLAGVPYYHLHYLYIAIGLYLLTPALRTFIKHAKPELLTYLIVTAFVISMADMFVRTWQGYELNAFSRFAPHVGYFCAGYLLRDRILSRKQLRWTWLAAIGAVALTAIGGGWAAASGLGGRVHWSDPLSPTAIVMSLAVFLISGSIASRRSTMRPGRHPLVRTLADASFGAYLIHPALLAFIHRYGVTCIEPNVWIGTIGVWIAVTVGSFFLAVSAQRVPYLNRVV